jgi:hypothetical protein
MYSKDMNTNNKVYINKYGVRMEEITEGTF